MEYLGFIGASLGLLANIPLLVGIYRGKVEQSFATFLLWAILDAIAATSIWLEGGNFWLPAAYTFGAAVVSLSLVFKKQARWTIFETGITVLVSACLCLWAMHGNKAGTIASVLALLIASTPQIKDTYDRPWLTPVGTYLLFSIGSLLSFLAGRDWSVKEKLYPGAALFLCTLILILAVRKTSAPDEIAAES